MLKQKAHWVLDPLYLKLPDIAKDECHYWGFRQRKKKQYQQSNIFPLYRASVWDGRDLLSKINDCLLRLTLIWPRFLFYFLQSHLVSLLVCQWDSSMAYIQYEQNWPIFIVPNSPFWNIFLFSIFKLWIVLSRYYAYLSERECTRNKRRRQSIRLIASASKADSKLW